MIVSPGASFPCNSILGAVSESNIPLLKPGAGEVGELPGPVGPVTAARRRAEGIAVHQAQRPGR